MEKCFQDNIIYLYYFYIPFDLGSMSFSKFVRATISKYFQYI